MNENNELEVNSGFCIFVVILSQVTLGLSSGITLSSLNSAAPAIAVFVNETYQVRYSRPCPDETIKLITVLAQSLLVWGALFGGFLVHVVTRKFSRKGGVALSHFLNLLSVILMSAVAKYAPSYEALIVGRFLSGVSKGIGYSIVPIVVAETICRRRLATYQGPISYLFFIGSSVGVALGHSEVLGTPLLWPWLTAFPGIFSIIYLCLWPWLPQTPAYHLKRGDRDMAKKTLRKLRTGDQEILKKELEDIEAEIDRDSKVHSVSILEMLRIPEYRRQMIAVFMTLNCTQLTGTQAIFLYSDNLFREAGVPEEYVTYASIVAFGFCVFPGTLAFIFIYRIGTRKLFLIGTSICLCGLVLFTISTALVGVATAMPYVALFAMAVFLFGSYFGVQITFFALPSELTTQTTRPTAIFLANIGYWIIGSLVGLVIPYSLSYWGAYAYIPFILGGLLEVIYVAFAVPETFNKSIEEIQRKFLTTNATQSGNVTLCRCHFNNPVFVDEERCGQLSNNDNAFPSAQ